MFYEITDEIFKYLWLPRLVGQVGLGNADLAGLLHELSWVQCSNTISESWLDVIYNCFLNKIKSTSSLFNICSPISMKRRDTRFKCQKCVGKTISGTNRSPKEHGRLPKHELDYRESFREELHPWFFFHGYPKSSQNLKTGGEPFPWPTVKCP